MDMGFWPDVPAHHPAISRARQTLLFSATMPNEVVGTRWRSARRKYVQVGQRSAPAKSITHHAERVRRTTRCRLIDHLRNPAGPVLIFHATKIAPIDWRGAWRPAGVRARRCTRPQPGSTSHRGRRSRAVSTRCSSRPTSRRAGSTSTRFTRHQLRSARLVRHVRSPRGRTGRTARSGRRSRSCLPKSGARWRLWPRGRAFI